MGKRKFTRRDFLQLSAAAATGALVAACAPAAPQIVEVEKEVPVEKVVKETVVVEKVVKEAAPPKAPVTIRYYDWKLTEEPGATVVRSILSRFEEANPHIKIKQESAPWADYLKKLIVEVQGGTAPDVAYITSDAFFPLVAMGALLPVTGLAEKYGVQDIWEQCPPAGVEQMRYKGLDYLAPRTAGTTDVLTYNMKLFEEAGLDPEKPPATWDELVEFGNKLTNPQKDQYGWGLMGCRGSSCARRALGWCLDKGAKLFSDDGKRCTLNSEEGVEGLTWWSDLELKYHIAPPGSVSADFQTIMRAYAQDKIAMWMGGPNNPKMGDEVQPGTSEKTKMAAKPDPWKPTCGFEGIVVTAQTRYPDEAFTVAAYLCSLEEQLEWCLGHGSVPCRADVIADPRLKKDRLIAETAEAWLPKAAPDPKLHVKWAEIQEFWFDAMAAVLSEARTPAQALADFEEEANKVLERWVATGA